MVCTDCFPHPLTQPITSPEGIIIISLIFILSIILALVLAQQEKPNKEQNCKVCGVKTKLNKNGTCSEECRLSGDN